MTRRAAEGGCAAAMIALGLWHREGEEAGASTRSHFRSTRATLPFSAQPKLTLSPIRPKLIRGYGPKVLKLSSNVSDVSRRSSS